MASSVISSGIASESSRIPFLNGSNFEEWKERILFTLGCTDLDLAFRVEEPPPLTEESSAAQKTTNEKWEKSNRLSLLLMQSHVAKNIRGSIPVTKTAKEFMEAIEQQFISSAKSKASTLMSKLTSMKYMGKGSVREHIMETRDIASQHTDIQVTFSESFLVHFILVSLPPEFGLLRVSYNTHKEKWSVNDLLTMCVEEEERLKGEKVQSAHMASHKGKRVHPGKDKSGPSKKKKLMPDDDSNGTKEKLKCFFCRKQGHLKKDCIKYKKWLEKKGLPIQAGTNPA